MKTRILLIGLLVSLSFFIRCSSDEKTTDVTAISNDEIIKNVSIDASIGDITNIAENQFAVQQNITNKSSKTTQNFLPSCAIITTTLVGNTWTRTVDFGTEGCTLGNGNLLKGKMIISFSNDFTTSTHTIHYTFEGFYHNGKKLEGNRSIVLANKSSDLLVTLHPVLTLTADMTITFDDGSIYTRKGTLTKETTAGFQTWFDWRDDVFVVTESGTTTFPNGDVFSAETTTPLTLYASCKTAFPVKGVLSITKNGTTATVDYGNGDCDTLATVTKNGVTEEIDLKK